jgi:hypothetical protein
VVGDRGVELALTTGVVDAVGARHRRVRLRPPTGREEGWFDDATAGDDLGGELDEVVAGVVERIGGYGPDEVTPGLLAALTRGDRRRLQLTLCALLDGDELRLSARCPNPDCQEVAEVVLSVAELVSASTAVTRPSSALVSAPDGDLLVHLPRGVDDASGERGAQAWARLVERVDDDGEAAAALTPQEWSALPQATRVVVAEALARLLEEAAPQAVLVARCPRCAAWLELDPDPADLLLLALRASAARLPAEVHVLAFHYGWSESAVLALPRVRRHRYLDLLGRELEGRPLDGAGEWLA